MFFAAQPRFRNGRRTKSRALVVVAVVCLALLAMLTVAQAVHTHPNPTVADHCPLCITMHTVVPAAVAVVALILVQFAVATPVFEVRAVSRHWHPQLFTRPPPSGF